MCGGPDRSLSRVALSLSLPLSCLLRVGRGCRLTVSTKDVPTSTASSLDRIQLVPCMHATYTHKQRPGHGRRSKVDARWCGAGPLDGVQESVSKQAADCRLKLYLRRRRVVRRSAPFISVWAPFRSFSPTRARDIRFRTCRRDLVWNEAPFMSRGNSIFVMGGIKQFHLRF